MATLIEIQTQLYQNILLNKQLPIPTTAYPQAECGRNVEKILEDYLKETKNENNNFFPTFQNGVDIQCPWSGDWEVKTRQLGGSKSRVNIGAITTSELDACIKYNIPFEDTDFSKYACKHIWSFYDSTYKIAKVDIWDMNTHKDIYEKAYQILLDPPATATDKYIPVSKHIIWENQNGTSWNLRADEKKLIKLFDGCCAKDILDNHGASITTGPILNEVEATTYSSDKQFDTFFK